MTILIWTPWRSRTVGRDNLTSLGDVQTKYLKVVRKLFPEKAESKKVSRRVFLEALVELYTNFGKPRTSNSSKASRKSKKTGEGRKREKSCQSTSTRPF